MGMGIWRRCGVAAFALGLFALAPAMVRAQGTDFALKDGDRVVFYGDSITDQRQYTVFVEDYAVTRFPKRNLRFIHSGWGGDRVGGGGGGSVEMRVARDVVPYRPTVITIMLGMNDGAYRPFDEAIFQTYTTGYRHLLDLITGPLPKARLTLIQPSPYDDVTKAPGFPGGYNGVLIRYGAFVKEQATERKAGVADLNTEVVAMLAKANETNPAVAKNIIPDRVHPGSAGHLIMAASLLKAWGAASLISKVVIDGGAAPQMTPKTTQTERAKVENLTRTADGALSWTAIEEALPFPLDLQDKTLELAVNSSDFVASLNQETLQVTNLTAPRYALKIDDTPVGDFSREELAAGINLATRATPMLAQSLNVHQLTRNHNDIHFTRWRTFQVPYDKKASPAALKKAMDGLDALEEDIVRQQRDAAQSKLHRFTLTPAP